MAELPVFQFYLFINNYLENASSKIPGLIKFCEEWVVVFFNTRLLSGNTEFQDQI